MQAFHIITRLCIRSYLLFTIVVAMKVTLSIILCLSASAAALSINKRQSGPVDPSTDPDCDYYDTAYSASDDCAYFEDFWGLSHSDFVAWVCVLCLLYFPSPASHQAD
jgi:hypothetical protein